MTTLVIDRVTLPESISSLFQTSRVRVQQRDGGGKAIITPVIDPDDYENETDYLSAIPGMMDSIIEGINAPDSECKRVPDDWINHRV